MPTGLATTGSSAGVGGMIAVIVAAHFPGMGAPEVAAWGGLVTLVAGFVAHSGWGGKFFPRTCPRDKTLDVASVPKV